MVDMPLLQAFDDCKSGNLKHLRQLVAKGVQIDATVLFNSNFSCLTQISLKFHVLMHQCFK